MRMLSLGLWLGLMTPCLADPLVVDGTRFRDLQGNQVILRGINVSGASKLPPFRGVRGAKDFDPLRGWGFNSIRLLFNWEAYQPEPDVYNEDYLQYYRSMIDWAAEQDLYVIVDIHQDAYSRFAVGGCGDGFPQWTLPPHQKPAIPDNGTDCSNWSIRVLFDGSMHEAWHHFYQNTWHVRDQYLRMLQHVAQAVADAPNVVGMGLLNEPWGWEQSELAVLYRDGTAAIREVIPHAIVFLSAHALTSSGLVDSHLPPIEAPNIVHETHYFDPGLPTLNAWNALKLGHAVQSWKRVEREWQAPIFLGAFGVSSSSNRSAALIDSIYDVLDRDLYSGAQWVYTPTWTESDKDGWNQENYSINDEEGHLRSSYRPRPYLEKTPGNLQMMRWDETEKALHVRYELGVEQEILQVAIPARLVWTGVDVPERRLIQCQSPVAYRLSCDLSRDRLGEGAVMEMVFRFMPKAQ